MGAHVEISLSSWALAGASILTPVFRADHWDERALVRGDFGEAVGHIGLKKTSWSANLWWVIWHFA